MNTLEARAREKMNELWELMGTIEANEKKRGEQCAREFVALGVFFAKVAELEARVEKIERSRANKRRARKQIGRRMADLQARLRGLAKRDEMQLTTRRHWAAETLRIWEWGAMQKPPEAKDDRTHKPACI